MVLDDSHLKQFADEGYVVVLGLLDGELDLQPVQDEYDEILDRLITKWHAEGRLEIDVRRLAVRRQVDAFCGRGRGAV